MNYKSTEEVEKLFAEKKIAGRSIRDIFFRGDDPFLDKNHMRSLYMNGVVDRKCVAKSIRCIDIPDDLEVTAGRSVYQIEFTIQFDDGQGI